MRIVILRALGLGDFLTAVPALRAIRRRFPNAGITLAAPRELEPLLQLLPGVVHDVADSHGLAALHGTAVRADIGINLHGSGPQSHRVLLGAGVQRLIAFRNVCVPQSADGPPFDPAEHEVHRWCRLLRHFEIPADPAQLELPRPPEPAPARMHGATLLHPGAASEARRWPADRWVEVARAELRAGRRVVVTGKAEEMERANSIAAAAGIPEDLVYAGRTNVLQLAALVAAAGRVVCGDTGVAHLASAFRRPSVVLFGPTSPTVWGPPPRAFHRVLWDGTCGDPHATRVDRGLLAISAARVIETLGALPVN